jgi:hypothetical protein
VPCPDLPRHVRVNSLAAELEALRARLLHEFVAKVGAAVADAEAVGPVAAAHFDGYCHEPVLPEIVAARPCDAEARGNAGLTDHNDAAIRPAEQVQERQRCAERGRALHLGAGNGIGEGEFGALGPAGRQQVGENQPCAGPGFEQICAQVREITHAGQDHRQRLPRRRLRAG